MIIPPSFKKYSSHDVFVVWFKKIQKNKKTIFSARKASFCFWHFFVLKREKTKQRWREEDHQEGAQPSPPLSRHFL